MARLLSPLELSVATKAGGESVCHRRQPPRAAFMQACFANHDSERVVPGCSSLGMLTIPCRGPQGTNGCRMEPGVYHPITKGRKNGCSLRVEHRVCRAIVTGSGM